MGELLHAFGIDWRILLINLINFGALLAVLWYFLYGPIIRMLEARREKAAQTVRDAEAIATERSAIEQARAGMLSKAGREADDIVAHAKKRGVDTERELLAKAEASAASVIADAEAQAREAKHRAVLESKEEVAKLIVLGIEKTLQK